MITHKCTSIFNHLIDSVSKSQLADKLHVTRNTLLKFHREYGLEFLTDYYESFPKVEGEIIDNLPLNPYQQWVLTKLILTYKQVPALLIQIELSKDEVLESFSYTEYTRSQQS